MILEHSLLTDRRTAKIFAGLPRTPWIIDVGPGIRPCPAFPCDVHVCIEPCGEYVFHLASWCPQDRTVLIARDDARGLLGFRRDGVTVLMLDVIEHIDRAPALDVLRIVESFEHAVIFTPLGWEPQGAESPDAWGLNGGHWQQHRSAWQPQDFAGWTVYCWEDWDRGKGGGAILAVR